MDDDVSDRYPADRAVADNASLGNVETQAKMHSLSATEKIAEATRLRGRAREAILNDIVQSQNDPSLPLDIAASSEDASGGSVAPSKKRSGFRRRAKDVGEDLTSDSREFAPQPESLASFLSGLVDSMRFFQSSRAFDSDTVGDMRGKLIDAASMVQKEAGKKYGSVSQLPMKIDDKENAERARRSFSFIVNVDVGSDRGVYVELQNSQESLTLSGAPTCPRSAFLRRIAVRLWI